ncbi:helix-turn-helix domain-containing protein [Streptomyces sp. C10-9-1]|uniref:helix-turn-helix domain-containing protein n=1 Tax=Streptomyces sp. C10-9-1 TaxID=1859285 RepID=UPI003F49CEC6
MAKDTEVAHGWTMGEIEHMTRLVLRLNRWHTAADGEEQYDAAWFGIVEYLLTADEPPGRGDLFRAGVAASDARVRDNMRTHGYCTLRTGQRMPRFHAYWHPANPRSPEGSVVERLAVRQIWSLLRPGEQRVLSALAATGDYERAAALLGLTAGNFSNQISTGRRAFLAAWHEHEEPSRLWRTDRHIYSRSVLDQRGRQRVTEDQLERYRERRQEGESVASLAKEAGVARGTLYRLLRGTSQPAAVSA